MTRILPHRSLPRFSLHCHPPIPAAAPLDRPRSSEVPSHAPALLPQFLIRLLLSFTLCTPSVDGRRALNPFMILIPLIRNNPPASLRCESQC
jgi:hypothetical protein